MPGGAQEVAFELFRAASHDPESSAVLLCCCEPKLHASLAKSGAIITGFDNRQNEFLFFPHGFEFFLQRITNPIAVRRFRDFLLEIRPDVIHFHHTLFFGAELLTLSRRICPQAHIAFTFHEFIPICHANGQMVRKDSGSLCSRFSPSRCHECFPEVEADAFAARREWFLSHFSAVDRFITPSEFIKQRYVEWGIEESRIAVIPNGQANLAVPAQKGPESRQGGVPENRGRFGFFGQLVDNKGLHVLLEAAEILVEAGTTNFEISVFGGNAHFATPEYRKRVQQSLERLHERGFHRVRLQGRYDHDQLPSLMSRVDWVVVPSTWWEIFGLVVSEAWMFGRPVIASDIGGLRERIRHGHDGLLFPAGDAQSLAQIMTDCLSRPESWIELHQGCRPPLSAEESWQRHKELYCAEATG